MNRPAKDGAAAVHALLTNSILKRLLDYWLAKRGDRLVPLWSEFDPVEMPWALHHLWICDHEAETGRFLYRLSGEAPNQIYGFNLKGRYLDEVIRPSGYETVAERYRTVVETPAAVIVTGRVYLRIDRILLGERLTLPMSRRGDAVDMVLGATVCRDKAPGAEEPAIDDQETVAIPLDRERGFLPERMRRL